MLAMAYHVVSTITKDVHGVINAIILMLLMIKAFGMNCKYAILDQNLTHLHT